MLPNGDIPAFFLLDHKLGRNSVRWRWCKSPRVPSTKIRLNLKVPTCLYPTTGFERLLDREMGTYLWSVST